MTIPLHTFKPTGDPCVDHENYFRDPSNPRVQPEDWFSRNPHVLSHDPEKIAREAIPFLTEERAPQRSGIYFLVYKERIVYVGKARSIYSRLESHFWRSDKKFDRYWCFGGIPYDWLTQAEGFYIKRCKPYWNSASVPYNPILDKIAKRVPTTEES
jgi:hypothetical protein